MTQNTAWLVFMGWVISQANYFGEEVGISRNRATIHLLEDFPCDSDGKESACKEGHIGLIPGLGRSPGKGNGYPLQYSFRGNPWNEDVGGLQFMGLQRVEQSN